MAGPLNPTSTKSQIFTIPTAGAGTAFSRAIWRPQFPGQIVQAWLSDDVGLATGSTIYSTIALLNGAVTMATITNNTGPITVDQMSPMTLSTTVANTKFNGGDTILLAKVDTGGGVAITNPSIQIDWVPGTYN